MARHGRVVRLDRAAWEVRRLGVDGLRPDQPGCLLRSRVEGHLRVSVEWRIPADQPRIDRSHRKLVCGFRLRD